MARNYEAELEALEAKRQRILKAKEAHEARNYMPIGKTMASVFPEVLDMKPKERTVWITHLRKLYDAEQQMLQKRSDMQSHNSERY